MKKRFIVSVVFLVVVTGAVFSLFAINKSGNNEKLNVEKQDDYILKFVVFHPLSYERYIFLLADENTIMAQYQNGCGDFEELSVKLDETMLDFMQPYIDTVLSVTDKDLTGNANFTDFWNVSLYCGETEVLYDYGVSECNAANILLEQIIGCCDFKSANKEKLQPLCVRQREFMEMYIEEIYNEK